MHYILTLLLPPHENSSLARCSIGLLANTGMCQDILTTLDVQITTINILLCSYQRNKSLIPLRTMQYYHKYKRVPFWSTALPSFDILRNGKRSMRHFCVMDKERYILSQWTSSFERNFALNKIHGTLKIFR
jgi:hypothetical protein